MKIAVDTIPLEVGGVQIEGEFTIKNSAKAFGILSSGLYSNKPAAILRELGANAYDSHVEAGKADVPFTVHLPTRLNPTLSIRDYGIGLDHHGVTKLYTTYFESTKTNSNDMIGCLGLGSKTPFSYTRNFTVVAIHNGMKRTYAAFINDAGIPAIALMGECTTDECNGLEVSFAVNKDDINTFSNEATKVYRWFKTKPEITGNVVQIPTVTFEERDIAPGSHLANINKNYYDRGSSYAIMGNIAYPISIPESVSEEDISKEVRALFSENSFVIEVGIGELDIAASREELSYVKLTIDTLRKRGEEILKGLEAFVNAKVAHLPTKWERTEELGRLIKTNVKLFSPAVEFYVKRNADKVLEGFSYDYYGAKVKVRLEDVAALCPGLRLSINEVHQSYRTSALQMRCERNDVVTTRNQAGQQITSTYATLFLDRQNIVLHDGKGSANQRIKAAITQSQASPGKQIVVVQALNKTVDRAVEFQRLLKFLGDPPANRVFYTSNMPRTGAARGENLKTLGVLSFEKETSYGRRHNDQWFLRASEADSLEDLETVQDKNGNDVYLYVPLMHKTIMRFEGNEHSLDMDANTFVNRMEQAVVSRIIGFAPQNKVYGIKRTSMHMVKDNPEWKNFWDFLEESFDAIDWNTAREKANNAIRKQAIENEFHFEKANVAKVKDIATRDTPFGKLAAAYLEVKAFPKAEDNLFYERLVTAMHSLYPDKDFKATGVKVNLTQARSDIEGLVKEVKKTYPLLAYLGLDREWNADAQKWEQALTYIGQVDKANG
jgi:hypothetical protein